MKTHALCAMVLCSLLTPTLFSNEYAAIPLSYRPTHRYTAIDLTHESHRFDQRQFDCSDTLEFHRLPTAEEQVLIEETPPSYDLPLFDLETLSQDFVLETKRICINGYPGAFNPSIARWHDSLLLCFRVRDSRDGSTNKIGLVYLDENFLPITTPKILEIRADSLYLRREQDPRLVVVGKRLFVVFSNVLPSMDREIRRMYIAEVHEEGTNFYLEYPESLTCFPGEKKERWEKNWVPFDYQGNLLLSYSIDPHLVFDPEGNGMCELFGMTNSEIKWDWGVLRGGTTALEHEGEYLAFFHSCKYLVTANSEGKKLLHYFMGAYTFSLDPPFTIKKISHTPIVSKGFYSPPFYKTWKPLRVVFPGGFIYNDKYVWILYGRQDHEICVAKLDKKRLMASLVPVAEK